MQLKRKAKLPTVIGLTTKHDKSIKLYLNMVGIPMVTNQAPLVADLFSFCYERDFMLSLTVNN